MDRSRRYQDREVQCRVTDSPSAMAALHQKQHHREEGDKTPPAKHYLSLKWAPPKLTVDAPGWDGDIPSDDLDQDDVPGQPLLPCATPDISLFHTPAGYENTTHGRPSIVPPPDDHDGIHQEQDHEFVEVTGVSETEARDLLLNYVSQQCCYGKAAAKNMHIMTIQESHSLYYKLETFAEGRTTSWTYEIYLGQKVEGPLSGKSPLPWEVSVKPDNMFENQVKRVEVPYTACVKSCYVCNATGYNRCYKCLGRGRIRCKFCGGSVHVQHKDIFTRQFCSGCSGTGRIRCRTCHGDGRIPCQICDGYRQLKWFIELCVQFTNHTGEHFVDSTSIPHDLMRQAKGQIALQNGGKRVKPIDSYPNTEICEGSKKLYNIQVNETVNEKILQQKHTLHVVPVAEILYAWNGKIYKFFVYGHDHKIFVPEYPVKCCWGCMIL
ncbi:protein SSUH2 homolog [Saccoglossus kowalevskii]|uniref:Protein SSUH2 homolog n=1 Tax=Saccoglossus kowalevskii TaxID=10224 RepID=A0ABM0N0F8_SACKO|nr:PREDICTED: protein SSUH2 homolog [Saccoglossus kowalevskii]